MGNLFKFEFELIFVVVLFCSIKFNYYYLYFSLNFIEIRVIFHTDISFSSSFSTLLFDFCINSADLGFPFKLRLSLE